MMLIVASFIAKSLWEAFGERMLTFMGLYSVPDAAYGRTKVPFSPMEKRLYSSPDIAVWFGEATMSNGKDWCWYQVWESKNAFRPREGHRRPDILFVHGTGMHSGTLASHSRRFLNAGFRLIVPDLLSHGYSSGKHVYRRHMSDYTEGLHAVLHDVARRDDVRDGHTESYKVSRNGHQPTFILGLSFGGTVALHYAIDYPSSRRDSLAVKDSEEIPIDGIDVIGPILGYSPKNINVPWYLVQFMIVIDKIGFGSVEFMVPHKKCLDKDPTVYKALVEQDHRSHKGFFRVGHLLCINEAVMRLHQRVNEVKHPVYIQQGGQDRVACPTKTVEWIRRNTATDKRMTVYPVCQHVIYRKAKVPEEDLAGRVVCILDSIDWMLSRQDSSRLMIRFLRSQEAAANTLTDSISGNDSVSPMTLPRKSPQSSTTSLSDHDGFLLPSAEHSMPAPTNLFPQHDRAESSSTNSSKESFRSVSSESGDIVAPCSLICTSSSSFLAPPLTYPSDFVTVEPEGQSYKHPLLVAPHQTTLPTLAKLCARRKYRPLWPHAEVICPFDVDVFPQWSSEYRAGLDAKARSMNFMSTFS